MRVIAGFPKQHEISSYTALVLRCQQLDNNLCAVSQNASRPRLPGAQPLSLGSADGRELFSPVKKKLPTLNGTMAKIGTNTQPLRQTYWPNWPWMVGGGAGSAEEDCLALDGCCLGRVPSAPHQRSGFFVP